MQQCIPNWLEAGNIFLWFPSCIINIFLFSVFKPHQLECAERPRDQSPGRLSGPSQQQWWQHRQQLVSAGKWGGQSWWYQQLLATQWEIYEVATRSLICKGGVIAIMNALIVTCSGSLYPEGIWLSESAEGVLIKSLEAVERTSNSVLSHCFLFW